MKATAIRVYDGTPCEIVHLPGRRYKVEVQLAGVPLHGSIKLVCRPGLGLSACGTVDDWCSPELAKWLTGLSFASRQSVIYTFMIGEAYTLLPIPELNGST